MDNIWHNLELHLIYRKTHFLNIKITDFITTFVEITDDEVDMAMVINAGKSTLYVVKSCHMTN